MDKPSGIFRLILSALLLAAALCVAPRTTAAAPDADGAGAMPPPGRADTFAQDTWLRRNRFPLRIKVIATDGKGGQNVPVTLSVACGQGDYPAGELCPMLGGEALAAQVDVLAAWPADKSIKHALVTVVLPNLEAGKAVELTFVQAAPPAPPAFVVAADLKSFAIDSRFVNPDGSLTTAAVPQADLTRLADVLAGKVAADAARKLAPRLAGPICYEFELKVPAKDGEAADPDIDIYYRLRVYSGVQAVRVEWDVENSRLPAKPYPKKFTIADRQFSKATFEIVGTNDQPAVRLELGPLTQWWATRYRVCRWWGSRPTATFAKEDAAYLIYSEFFPKIDLEHPLTDAQRARQEEKVTGASWHADPADNPDGVPLSNGPVTAYMGMTGGRADIGYYPTWDLLALATDSPTLAYAARCADGNGLAAFPVHKRPGESGQPGIAYDDPIRGWLYDVANRPGRPNPVEYSRVKQSCPNRPDAGHLPSASYYTYLATGEKFYEEEMAFWSADQLWGSKGYQPSHDRYSAWPLRNATDAAFILPDAHPMKRYFIDYVQRSLDYQVECMKDMGAYYADNARRTVSGRKDFVCSGQFSMWQQAYYLCMLDNAARKGFASAANVRDKGADLLLRLYEGKEEFKAPDGKVYRSLPNLAIPYSTAVNLMRVDWTDPAKPKVNVLRNITANSGEVFYYSMLNAQHAYTDNAKLAAALPKKVMEPEDWRLDPAYYEKHKDDASYYTYEPNGWTSAALARYDNPRAQAMYGFVRKYMDGFLRPDRRIRGIELVK
ncbi:MAG: hypothetical protein BIFFINMI_01439 [Phycisphaerae bacterium]|nr:hypothetical protein [Phycisphaerae bacterium]